MNCQHTLVPDSEYTITVTLYETRGENWTWARAGKYSETFDTTGECYVHTNDNGDPDPDDDPALKPRNRFQPKWFGGALPGTRTETSIEVVVSINEGPVNDRYADVNSGRCLYYKYAPSGGATVGPLRTYVIGPADSRRAIVSASGLKPGKLYSFSFDFHPDMLGLTQSRQTSTYGPPLAVRSLVIDNITQT